MICPCCSGKSHDACCEPYHLGAAAATAEAVMRSRYSAFALGRIDYLITTLHPDVHYQHDFSEWSRWSQQSEWLGLVVHHAIAGQAAHDVGLVRYTARWRDSSTIQQAPQQLQEHAVFRRYQGTWRYVDGSGDHLLPSKKQPCLCGSGIIFKRCCGG